MFEDIKQQMVTRIKANDPYYALKLDESTDVSDGAFMILRHLSK